MSDIIKGYIKRIAYCSKNDEDDDENNDSKFFFTICDIYDDNDNDYTVKGVVSMCPEVNDIIICKNYNIKKETYRNTTKNVIYPNNKNEDIFTIKLPENPNKINERIIQLKKNKKLFKGYAEKNLKPIIEKYKENIWFIENIENIENDKLINNEFKISMGQYISYKLHNCDLKTKYIIDYICDKYNITLTKNEYKKIQNNLYTHKITYPITDDVYEQLLLSLCGNIDDKKIILLVEKLELNDIIKNKIDILLELRRRIDNGNSCMKEKYIIDKFNDEEKQIVEQNILDLISDDYIVRYNDYIYDKKQYDYEINIANKLKDYYNKNSKLGFRIENDINLDDLENNNFDFNLKGKIELNDEQKSGILNSWNNPISIITGGPGYGKTTIIKSILQNCYNKFILILAPTGIVVSKIQEDLNAHEKEDECEVITIHKFLLCKELNKHKQSFFIIIDEFTMISNKLFNDFLNIITKFNFNAKIILLGDCDQLPAIESGNILKNLISSRCFSVTKLITSNRNKGELLSVIQKIKTGEIPENNDDFCFIKTNDIELCKPKLINKIKELIEERQENDKKATPDDIFSNMMIMTATNQIVSDFTNLIRDKIHKMNNRNISNNDYAKGDIIMINKNIYLTQQNKYRYPLKENTFELDFNLNNKQIKINKINNNSDNNLDSNSDSSSEEENNKLFDAIKGKINLFNGMVGKIIDVNPDKNGLCYYEIGFGGANGKNANAKQIKLEKSFMNRGFINKFSYINTIHKYQGSENKIAIIILIGNAGSCANRNLIYTAISRAKKKCIVIGEENIFVNAISKQIKRVSQLNMMIKECFGKINNNSNIHNFIKNEKIENKKKIGIPTKGYGNIIYRSRIEAKWSYFMKYLGWNCIYEPYDFNGYVPDFIVKDTKCENIKNLFIEVKSDKNTSEYDNYYNKALESGFEGALLILDYSFEKYENDDFTNCINLGKLYFINNKKTRTSDFIIYRNENNTFSSVYKYKNNYYDKIDYKCLIDVPIIIFNNTTIDDYLYMESYWNKISNDVQYKKPIIKVPTKKLYK